MTLNMSQRGVHSVFVSVLLLGLISDFAEAECVPPVITCDNCAIPPSNNDSFPVGSLLQWTCTDGYVMVGDGDIVVWVCGIDDQWLGDMPNCTELACPDPPVPSHGSTDRRPPYHPGDRIVYTCEEGYTLEGSNDAVCEAFGSWSNKEPFCNVECGDTDHPYNTCFFVGAGGNVDWEAAKQNCEPNGGMLALVKDDNIQSYLETLPKNDNRDYWIGATEGRAWKWKSDNANIERTFWNQDEPNDSDGNEKCIELTNHQGKYVWNDVSCSIELGSICQINMSCDNATVISEEFVANYRRKCYQFVTGSYTQDSGDEYCRQRGGHLAEIYDASTQDFLSTMATVWGDIHGNQSSWWIGGYDDTTHNVRSWFWIDGSRISDAQWGSREPNKNNENCVDLWEEHDWKWNDDQCDESNKRRSICQRGISACGDLGEPMHGSRTPDDRFTFLDGAMMEFQCDPGFERNGVDSVKCLVNGSWDAEKPTCEAVTCPVEARPVLNAYNLTTSSTEYRGVTIYTCSQGFIPDAPPTSYCQADGTWSTPNFTCSALPPCYSNPCKNGGSCEETDSGNYYHCTCAGGFAGKDCEEIVTPPASTQQLPTTTSPKPASSSERTPALTLTSQAGTASTFTFTPVTIITHTSMDARQGLSQPVVISVGVVLVVIIIIVIIIITILLVKRRRRPNTKVSTRGYMDNAMTNLTSTGNKYERNGDSKPGLVTGTHNAGFSEPEVNKGHTNMIPVGNDSEPYQNIGMGYGTEYTLGISGDDEESADVMVDNHVYSCDDPEQLPISINDGVKVAAVSTAKIMEDNVKSPPLYATVNKNATHGPVNRGGDTMIENAVYEATDDDLSTPFSSGSSAWTKTHQDLNGERRDNVKPAPRDDTMIDNELYSPQSAEEVYEELEDADQQYTCVDDAGADGVYEETLHDDDEGVMVENDIYSVSDGDDIAAESEEIYVNADYHDKPGGMVDSDLYSMQENY